MKKYRTKIKDGQLVIKNRLARGEELNNRELEILARNNIRGLARVHEVSSHSIVFTSAEASPLNAYLSSGLNREDFAFVVAQIVRIAQKINEYSLQQNNLELTVENVYIVKKTRELIFIYRPVISTGAASDINSFLNSVIRCTSFSMQQDTKYVEELERVLRQMEKFPSELVSNYVRRLDAQIFNLFLADKTAKKKYEDDDLTGLLDEDDDLTGILDEDDDLTGLLDEDDDLTGILDEDDDLTGLLDETESDSYGLPAKNSNGEPLSWGGFDDDEEQTGLLNDADDMPTGILFDETEPPAGSSQKEKEIEGQSLLFGNDDEGDLYGYYGRNFGNAAVRDEEDVVRAENNRHKQDSYHDDRTTLFREEASMPWLQRCSNGERREIDKPIFRIGKDMYHVDYFVDRNPAVSRNHAHIVSRNGRYYIVDDNSLNHSFVDGMIIPVQKEYEIFEGSNICLANEEFIFHVR